MNPNTSKNQAEQPRGQAVSQPQPVTQPGQTSEAGSQTGNVGYSGSLQARSNQGQVSGRSSRGQTPSTAVMRPPVDIFEDEGGVTLLADLPGVSREQLEVRVDGDTLLIEGTAAVPQVGEMDLLYGELLSPVYRRSFTLSRDLDTSRIDAQLTQGVLRVRLHKVEQAKPRRISIKTA